MIEVLKNIRHSIRPIEVPFWAKSGHAQTLLGHLLPSTPPDQSGEAILISLNADKEKIHSTYYAGIEKVVVYLFHGLGGSSEAKYMVRTAMIARKLGCHVFMNNHRGCGAGVGLASEPYHSGKAEDLSSVISYGREKFPDHFHVAIGFSLSANALLLLAAKFRAQILPDLAIAVNAPINLESSSLHLCNGLNWIYNLRFVFELKEYVKQNRFKDYHLVKNIFNLRTMDKTFTAPVGGFKSREDYYETCSAAFHLKNICIPTVLMSAEDDPFVRPEDYLRSPLSDQCVLHLEKHGGHMGYLSEGQGSEMRWLDLALEKYLAGIIAHLSV